MSIDLNMLVLAVDDSGTMRMMMKQILKKVGFKNIIQAKDGNDAIAKLEANEGVSLILSDWNMPGKDGMDLLQWLRQQDKYKNLPFIMATAQADKSQQEAVKNEGGNGLIPKPFTAEEIQAIIEEVWGVGGGDEKAERKFVNDKPVMKIAHIQITDHLALGMLKHQIDNGEVEPNHFELEPLRIPGWNPIVQSLEKGDIDGALVLGPIAMDLFAFDTPIKLVLLAHKNGSIFVRSKTYSLEDDFMGSRKDFYKYKVVDIPHKMSIHNMLAHKYLTKLGLKPGVPGKKAINVRFEVVPPIKMPEIMKENDSVGGFIVAEPIGSNAIAKGIAEMEFVSSSMWPDHPCCIVAMRQEFIDEFPDAVYEFTELMVKAGKTIDTEMDLASEVAVNFLDPMKKIGLKPEIIKSRVLDVPQGIKMNDLYPVLEDLDTIQRYMHDEMGIGVMIDVEKFVDIRFADNACK